MAVGTLESQKILGCLVCRTGKPGIEMLFRNRDGTLWCHSEIPDGMNFFRRYPEAAGIKRAKYSAKGSVLD